jgi:hypothetical protein
MDDPDPTAGSARYVFRVSFRLEPEARDVSVDPAEFETTLSRAADQPGDDGWLFFRDNLWRGEVNDDDHFRELTEDALGVSVVSVSFSELRTDEAYLDALRGEVAARLGEFNSNSVDQVLSKFLGSSIHVVEKDG